MMGPISWLTKLADFMDHILSLLFCDMVVGGMA